MELHVLKEIVAQDYEKRYGYPPPVIVSAPGRINLIGEHTDYNQGYVLPAAINKHFVFAIGPNEVNVSHVTAIDLNESGVIDFANLERQDLGWINYLIGNLKEFDTKNLSLKNFNCSFSSSVPIGSGLSSSAALECSFIKAIATFNGHALENWEMVNMSHHSNHHFLGIKGGILDQFASIFGKKETCLFLNCADRKVESHTIDLLDHELVLINTKVTHNHAEGSYNDRPSECAQLLAIAQGKYPDVTSVSALTESQLFSLDVPEKLFHRGQFILAENKRVLDFLKALEMSDIQTMGDLLYASHKGLSEQYEVSCDELDLLVSLTLDKEEVVGSRMMGGGFGGCTLNLMKKGATTTQVLQSIMSEYQHRTGIEPESYRVVIDDGAKVLKR